jgi:AraC-like DNA-binding protein
LIESGSLQPGVSATDFGLPQGTALRYERPADALRHLLPSYAVFDSDPSIWQNASTWKLPSWAQIWIILADGKIAAKVRNRSYAALGKSVLYGATSRAISVTTNGGMSVVADISPMGWARFFNASAADFRDRVTPLDQLWPEGWAEALVSRILDAGSATETKPVLDAFFLERLPPPHRHEPILADINERLLSEDMLESGAIAADLGINSRTLLRLCTRYFGFGPKLLQRRTRFLRALSELILDDAPDFSVVPAGYYDVPHFVRDGKHFLGITPRQYFNLQNPYLHALLRVRRMVLGAPLSMLDRGLRPTADQ